MRLTPTERACLGKLADDAGETPTQFARRRVFGAMKARKTK
jgi:hypothetical protein